MKATYPIIIHQADQTGYHFVEIPDFGGFTQGKDLNDCLEMAQDYINLSVIDLEDHNAPIPPSSDINCLELGPGQVKSLVAIDTVSYRREKIAVR
ncbi:type II toxin-antitoxin system HicB family antitoxin [Peptococcus simiae]|uniref:type II toxin-antitoxin system HicB family antitoxin n=1 Tax=Peptococcus simiae TaxID=1643805 RepID=UPI00397F0ACF